MKCTDIIKEDAGDVSARLGWLTLNSCERKQRRKRLEIN